MIEWHPQGFKGYGAEVHLCRVGRPKIEQEIRDLSKRMSRILLRRREVSLVSARRALKLIARQIFICFIRQRLERESDEIKRRHFRFAYRVPQRTPQHRA